MKKNPLEIKGWLLTDFDVSEPNKLFFCTYTRNIDTGPKDKIIRNIIWKMEKDGVVSVVSDSMCVIN